MRTAGCNAAPEPVGLVLTCAFSGLSDWEPKWVARALDYASPDVIRLKCSKTGKGDFDWLNLGATVEIVFVSSESFPLAKTGGLADVSAALPKASQRSAWISVPSSLATRPPCVSRPSSGPRPTGQLA